MTINCPKCKGINVEYDEMISYNFNSSSEEFWYCNECNVFFKVHYKLTVDDIYIDN